MVQKNYAYFQEFLANNDYDIRITVIGDRAFGFIRNNRDNDFRASGSGKVNYDMKNIPIESIRIAYNISRECGFQSMAYDFLYDKEQNLCVNEISYCYVKEAVHNCMGYWDQNLNWVNKQLWPEEAHIDDFIKLIKSKP